MGGRASETLCCCRCTRQLEEIKVYVLVFHGHGLCTTSFIAHARYRDKGPLSSPSHGFLYTKTSEYRV